MADVAGFAGAQGRSGEARQAARAGLRVVHRGLRPRAVEHRRRARRARGPVRGGRGARASDRQRHGVHRLAQPRPGPRDDVRAGRRRRGSAFRSRTSTSSTATPGRVPFGMGTYGSRSLSVGGTAIVKALDKIVAKGKKIAAHLLEAAETDIEFKDGKFTVAGTDRSKTFGEVALTAYVPHNYPLDKLEPGLERDGVLRSDQLHVPGGHAHLRSRDRSRHRRRARSSASRACDDFGNIINPMIVEGQVHGGVAQGIGQALLENCVYDTESGQLLTGSFMDYAMPRADDVPSFKVGDQGHAVHAQSARRQGLRRSRRDRRAGGADERRARRARAASASSTSTCRHRRIACGRRCKPRKQRLRRRACTHSNCSRPKTRRRRRGAAARRPAARPLAGGQSLVAAMKLRLAQPGHARRSAGDRRAQGHPQGRRRARRSAR